MIPAPAMSNLIMLQTLDLSMNPLSTMSTRDLSSLPQLTNVTVTRCPVLTSVQPGVFSDNNVIQHLNISNNPQLSSWSPDFLHGSNSLIELDISDNNLSTVILPKLPSLQQIKLENNPWLCDCKLIQMQLKLLQLKLRNSPLCHRPRGVSDQVLTQVKLVPCDSHTSEEYSEENLSEQHYFIYLLISASCLSIIGLVFILSRRKLCLIISQLR